MSHLNDLHDQAMMVADDAFLVQRRGETARAVALFQSALDLETQAAELVREDLTAEPTRSVLYRSAASLAMNGSNFEKAEQLIEIALAGNPPNEIEAELLNLRSQIGTQWQHASPHDDQTKNQSLSSLGEPGQTNPFWVQPPALVTSILLFLPEHNREPIVGDLVEEYQYIVKAFGERNAKGWYRIQAFASFVPYLEYDESTWLRRNGLWKFIWRNISLRIEESLKRYAY